MRRRDVADHSEIIRLRAWTNLKGQPAPIRMSLQSSRAVLSFEKRLEVYAEFAKVPLINNTVPCAAESIALNGISQILHSGGPNLSRTYCRAEDSQRPVRRTKLEDVGIHAANFNISGGMASN